MRAFHSLVAKKKFTKNHLLRGKMPKIVIEQDDAAPDGFESFDKDFVRIFGVTVEEFKSYAAFEKNDTCLKWIYDGYVLEFCSDYPIYTMKTF